MIKNYIDRSNLSLAGEYAVASEICRRGIYAQITLGNLKRTDLLIFNSETEKMIRVEVKSKKKNVWPAVKGMKDENCFLILVDFSKKELTERPDFYIVDSQDWKDYLDEFIIPDKKFKELKEEHIPVWQDNFKGAAIKPTQVEKYKEKWDKIIKISNKNE